MQIIKVKNPLSGVDIAKEILYKNVNTRTVLFLSGGSTPKLLYETLAQEKKLNSGAVAMVDERFGERLHIDSNELMIKNTKFLNYLESKNIKFFPILNNESLESTSLNYDETSRFLFNHFSKTVAIMGIGEDGHTAGIPIGTDNSISDLVTFYTNFPGKLNKRISLTYAALEQIDLLIVLVFGKEKQKILNKIFKEGSLAEIPARIFQKLDNKTLLITDLKT